jgi:hypothetical protein
MKMSNCTGAMVLTGEVVKGHDRSVFKMSDGVTYVNLSIDANAYPIGMRITITLEEPEPPKERVVLPEGMAWIDNLLFTNDGALIAGIRDRDNNGWHKIPFQPCYMDEVQITVTDEKEKRKVIEAALAEYGYFGVRKVVNNG